jgi:hypothetical protein
MKDHDQKMAATHTAIVRREDVEGSE